MGRLFDDRGRALSGVVRSLELERKLDWRQKTAYMNCRNEDRRRVAASTAAIVLLAVGVAGPIYSVVAVRGNDVGLISMAVVSAVLSGAGFALARRWGHETDVRFAKTAGWCGGCGYGLSGFEPEDDGCVVCPECGAAWKVGASMDEPTA